MPWKSRWHCDIPQKDLSSYVFPSQTESLGDKPFLFDADKSDRYNLTHNSYRLWCKRVAAGLIKNGLQPGDRVLLFSGNTLFFPVVFLGIVMAEGIFSGANPTYVPRELAYQLKDTGAKFLICAEATLDTSLEAADSIGFPHDRIFVFDNGYSTFDGTGQGVKDIKHWSHLLASPEDAELFRWKTLSTLEEVQRTVCLNYSSGTTGLPKGVCVSHRNLIANVEQTVQIRDALQDYDPRDRPEERWVGFLPLYHAFGM